MKRALLAACCVAFTGTAACSTVTQSDKDDDGAASNYNKGVCVAANHTEAVNACMPATADYRPREGVSAAHGWPACISDDNVFHLVGESAPPAVSRSVAFEAMAKKLWANETVPTKDDFLSARDDYSVSEGLASRVGRRQDISYPEVPGDNKFSCADGTVATQYPDRCAGPGRLKPIIDDAFQKGIAQDKPLVQAVRIEAALLWFFYLSMTSEVWTCSFDDITDCDAAAGYYTQITARNAPAGLAKYVHALGAETHNRVYDALLAERCWRDATKTEMPATSHTDLYNAAQSQLAKATLRGEALILRERIGWISCTSGDAQEANIEFAKILGTRLNHAASGIDSGKAAALKAYTDAPSGDATAIASAQANIDAIFNCP